jgi:CRP/FNR family transcriptional regulator
MNRPVFVRGDERNAADDGDAFNFCSTCAFSQACLAQGMNRSELAQLHVLVEHVGPYQAGDRIFGRGDPFGAIAAVRGGSVKTCVTDVDGRERVLGFHFPGEVIGLDGIDGERYPCDAVALDTVVLCRFAFPRMADLATRLPLLQQHLFRLLSRDIHTATRQGGDWSADTRIAAFLVDIGRRLASRGFSPRRFELTMARTDIANYLRLAPETVSRVLRRFQEKRLVAVDRREIELIDVGRLESLAAPALST